MRRIYLLLAALIGISAMATAQSNLGSLAGKVIDETTKKPIEFATVTIEGGGGTKKTKYSDKDGEFEFTAIPAGNYNVSISYTGYGKSITNDIPVKGDNKITNRSFTLTTKSLGVVYISDLLHLHYYPTYTHNLKIRALR